MKKRESPCTVPKVVNLRWRALLWSAFLAALTFSSAASASTVDGHLAPDFALRALDAGNVRVSEHRGDVVVVSFWATWCSTCQQELTRLDDLYRRYQRTGLVVFAINLDEDVLRAQQVSRRLALAFPVLFDPTKATARRYEVDAMPMTVLIDREGLVRHVHSTYRAEDDSVYLEQLRELIDE